MDINVSISRGLDRPGPEHGLKRKRASRDDIAWTAAKCNRLLRTISSRISILRKLASHGGPSIKQNDSSDNVTASNISETPNQTFLPASDATRGEDPDWLPPADLGNRPRTYGGRLEAQKATLNHDNFHPSLAFRTPFLKKILDPSNERSPLDAASPVPAIYKVTAGRNRKQYARKLPIKPSSTAEEAHRNLISAFDALLASTCPPQPPSRAGAPSLMSMCLRKVPELIETEQAALEDETGMHAIDVSSEYYSDLESHFGSSQNAGWHGLRQLVRAHGLKLVLDSMRDGLIPERIFRDLVEVCQKHRATTELRDLLCTSVHATKSGKNLVAQLLRPQFKLLQPGIIFQTLEAALLTRKVLPAELVDRTALWQELLKSLTSDTRRSSAWGFLNAFVLGFKDEKLPEGEPDAPVSHKTIEHVATVLTAIAAGCFNGQAISGDASWVMHPDIVQLMHRLATSALLNAFEPWPRHAGKSDINPNLIPFSMGSLLLSILGVGIDDKICFIDVDALVSTLHKCKDNRFGPEFICAVARCMSHLNQNGSHELMRTILENLADHPNVHYSRETSSYLRQLALDTAFEYAENSTDKRCLALAEEIEELVSFSSTAPVGQTPVSGRKQAKRFRWEESISEWIAATPLAAGPAAKKIRKVEDSPLHDSGICLDFDDKENDEKSVEQAFTIDGGQPEFLIQTQRESAVEPSMIYDTDDEDELALAIPAPSKRRRVLELPKPPDFKKEGGVVRQAKHQNRTRNSQKHILAQPLMEDDMSADELA